MSIPLSLDELAWKHWRAVALVALLIAAALIAHAWFAAHRSAAALSATLAASQKHLDAAAASEKARDAQLATQLAQIAALEKKVQTPQQALAALPSALPPLPQPITISPSAPSSANAQAGGAGNQPASAGANTRASNSANAQSAAQNGASLPAAPGVRAGAGGASASAAVPSNLAPIVANIPQADLQPLYDYFENCQATTLDRDTAKKDLADAQTQVTALTQQRDAAVTSAKGGSFWTRLRRGAKWFAIGAATGAVVGAVAAHH
ncbi:MAG: hypothetical protein WBF06_13030 [Candidatus Acidiferrales bacterium]